MTDQQDGGSVAAMLAELHTALGQSFGDGGSGRLSRMMLQEGEHRELMAALASGDLAEVAHELADVVYAAYGTAYSLGIPLDEVIAVVHAANMSKRDESGAMVLDADGKIVKPPGFVPPDVAGVLRGHEVGRGFGVQATGIAYPANHPGATLGPNVEIPGRVPVTLNSVGGQVGEAELWVKPNGDLWARAEITDPVARGLIVTPDGERGPVRYFGALVRVVTQHIGQDSARPRVIEVGRVMEVTLHAGPPERSFVPPFDVVVSGGAHHA